MHWRGAGGGDGGEGREGGEGGGRVGEGGGEECWEKNKTKQVKDLRRGRRENSGQRGEEEGFDGEGEGRKRVGGVVRKDVH